MFNRNENGSKRKKCENMTDNHAEHTMLTM